MQSKREVLSTYKVCLTRSKLFDSSENIEYTTYGVLVCDDKGDTRYEVEDFHTNRRKVEVFIGRMVDPKHLRELAEDYLDGCDDLSGSGRRGRAGKYTCV